LLENAKPKNMKAIAILLLICCGFAWLTQVESSCSDSYRVSYFGGLHGKPQYPFTAAFPSLPGGQYYGVRAKIDLLYDGEVQGIILFVEDEYYLNSKLREFQAAAKSPQAAYMPLSTLDTVLSSLVSGIQFQISWSIEGCVDEDSTSGYTVIASCTNS